MNGETKSKILLVLIVGVVAIACGTIVSAFVHIDLPQENLLEDLENETILSINDSNTSINNTTTTPTKTTKKKTTTKTYKKTSNTTTSSSTNQSSNQQSSSYEKKSEDEKTSEKNYAHNSS